MHANKRIHSWQCLFVHAHCTFVVSPVPHTISRSFGSLRGIAISLFSIFFRFLLNRSGLLLLLWIIVSKCFVFFCFSSSSSSNRRMQTKCVSSVHTFTSVRYYFHRTIWLYQRNEQRENATRRPHRPTERIQFIWIFFFLWNGNRSISIGIDNSDNGDRNRRFYRVIYGYCIASVEQLALLSVSFISIFLFHFSRDSYRLSFQLFIQSINQKPVDVRSTTDRTTSWYDPPANASWKSETENGIYIDQFIFTSIIWIRERVNASIRH